MCIHCRRRFDQHQLLRLQCVEKVIVSYRGVGRSFYICSACLEDKKLSKSLARICKIDPTSALNMLKELLQYG